MFDTHAVARALTEADLTPAQADAITDAVRLAAEHDAAGIDVETLATKSDVAAVKSDLTAVEAALKSDVAAVEAALKSDMAAVEAALKSDMAAVKAALKSDMAAVKSDVAAVEAALKSDVAAVKSDVAAVEAVLKSDMAALEARLNARTSAQETRLIKWMVGVGVGVAGLVVAALRLLGPGVAP